jgi:hypothetical protein
MTVRALLVWFALLVLAIVNGGFRQVALVPSVGLEAALAVSTLLLCAGILLVTWLAVPWIRPAGAGQAIGIGAGWLALTLAFEFGFGHFVGGRSWMELTADYNVLKGRIWVLVLVTTAVAPWVTGRLRGVIRGTAE